MAVALACAGEGTFRLSQAALQNGAITVPGRRVDPDGSLGLKGLQGPIHVIIVLPSIPAIPSTHKCGRQGRVKPHRRAGGSLCFRF